MHRIFTLFGLLLLLPACADPEGNDAGECTDGADNDEDGYFDCADRDCWGSPDCGGPGSPVRDDDDASDDDDAADDDDTADDDDDAVDDDDATAADDDDTTVGDGMTPWIEDVTYTYNGAGPNLVFSIEAHDPDMNFGVPLLVWSVDAAPQTPVNVGNIPLQGDAYFDVQLDGVTPGQTYQLSFVVVDDDNLQSAPFPLSATAQ